MLLEILKKKKKKVVDYLSASAIDLSWVIIELCARTHTHSYFKYPYFENGTYPLPNFRISGAPVQDQFS